MDILLSDENVEGICIVEFMEKEKEKKIKTFCIEKNVRDNIKVWGAIITGKHEKYVFDRDFKYYRYLSDCSSKHAYYNYYIDVEEGQYFEIGIKNKYKNKRYYYRLENGEFIPMKQEEVAEVFKGGTHGN